MLQDNALRVAIEAGDVDGQVKAQEQIARLAQDASRLGALKDMQKHLLKKKCNTYISTTNDKQAS